MDRRVFLTGAAAAGLAVDGAGAQARVKILVPDLPPEDLAELRAAAPRADIVVCKSNAEALARIADADATYGLVSAELIRAGKKLRWIQMPSAGVEHVVNIPELAESNITLTNMQGIFAPEIADQALGYLLCFTRSLTHFINQKGSEQLSRGPEVVLEELLGKTMQIIGMGGIGSNIAQRAKGFGMTILATDPKVSVKPVYVDELSPPAAFHRFLPRADVLVSAVPLTPVTRKMVGERAFGLLKPGALLLNMSRGGVVDTDALVRALVSKRLGGAGLDVTDPEPLPKGHPLWKQNIVITPHTAGTSPGGFRRAFAMFRENLVRFSNGETPVNVVDKKAGY